MPALGVAHSCMEPLADSADATRTVPLAVAAVKFTPEPLAVAAVKFTP